MTADPVDHTRGIGRIAAEIEAQRRKVELETARLQALLVRREAERDIPKGSDR